MHVSILTGGACGRLVGPGLIRVPVPVGTPGTRLVREESRGLLLLEVAAASFCSLSNDLTGTAVASYLLNTSAPPIFKVAPITDPLPARDFVGCTSTTGVRD